MLNEVRVHCQFLGLLESNVLNIDLTAYGIQPFVFEKLDTDNLNLPEIAGVYRLGHRVEHLFKSYLSHSDRYQLIAYNVQISDTKRTIGELDFIINDLIESQLFHLELVYKFYCYDGSISEDENLCWIGPNRKDNISLKKKKLIEKQFPLLRKEETLVELKKDGIRASDLKQEICFFAQLFIPWETYITDMGARINSDYVDNIVGYYIDYKTWMVETGFKNCQYFVPQKQDWLVDPSFNREWESFEQINKLVSHAMELSRSTLMWVNLGDGRYEKCFVVWW